MSLAALEKEKFAAAFGCNINLFDINTINNDCINNLDSYKIINAHANII